MSDGVGEQVFLNLQAGSLAGNDLFTQGDHRLSHRHGEQDRLSELLCWCGPIALGIVLYLGIRQASPQTATEAITAARNVTSTVEAAEKAAAATTAAHPVAPLPKPRILLAILTPVNLFTGVLSCGLVSLLTLWMDRRWLPAALQPPLWLVALNILSAAVFVGLGLKGYWDNENRLLAVGGILGLLVIAIVVATVMNFRSNVIPGTLSTIPGEQPS